MTMKANIADSLWELGLLRSMGCTRSQITRVMIYELISNTFAAMFFGFAVGMAVSVLTIAQFHIVVELPLVYSWSMFPLHQMMATLICATVSLYIGARYGTQILYDKNIATTLKGL